MKGIFVKKLLLVSTVTVLMLSLMTACADMAKTEYGEMTGELHLVREDLMIVDSGGEETEVQTNADTKYYLGDDDHLSVKDIINPSDEENGSDEDGDSRIVVRISLPSGLSFTIKPGMTATIKFAIGS